MKTKTIASVTLQVLASLIIGLQASLSQGTATTRQVLSLQVLELNKIGLVGSNFTLIINSVDPKSFDFIPALSTNSTLVWTSNGENKKITVASNSASPKFPLKLVTQKAQGAALASPEVKFSDNASHDLIVGVAKSAGKCEIYFASNAGPEHAVGSETQVITFTITGS